MPLHPKMWEGVIIYAVSQETCLDCKMTATSNWCLGFYEFD